MLVNNLYHDLLPDEFILVFNYLLSLIIARMCLIFVMLVFNNNKN
jgi:hypothetical protein